MMIVVQLLGGLVLLLVGGDQLVRGSSSFAKLLRLSPLFIGLTVVAFGTSSPELAVSIQASQQHESGISVGNIIGSNIFNLLFILGLSSLITPLAAVRQIIRRDIPFLIAASLLVFLLCLDGQISRLEGAFLLLPFLGFLGYQLTATHEEVRKENPGRAANKRRTSLASVQIIAGLLALLLGARSMVTGAVAVAEAMGVSTLLIGLTIVGIGTSLPEVAASVVASLRNELDIAMGNVVGSNVFNLLAVLGISALVSSSGLTVLPEVTSFDFPILLAATFFLLPVLVTGGKISRSEGAVMLVWYLVYLSLLVISAKDAELFSRLRIPAIGIAFLVMLVANVLSIPTWRQSEE